MPQNISNRINLYKKMNQEDDDYCYLIYEDLYEDGVARFNELSETEFKKLIRKHYNYIKKNCKRRFLLINQLHAKYGADFF